MADSDHTRIDAAVTRRKALKAAAGMMSVPFQIIGPTAKAGENHSGTDPAVTLWRAWRAARLQTNAICHKQQTLEALLMRTVGMPRAEVETGDGTIVILAREDDIDDLLEEDPALAEACQTAKADLAAAQARWAEADDLVGYSSALREELAAADHAQRQVVSLTVTPAMTLAGVVAKLDMILREGETCEDCEEFPWREIRLTLLDLMRIGQSLQPGSFMPSQDPMEPWIAAACSR